MFKRYFVDDIKFFKLMYMQMTGRYKNPLEGVSDDCRLRIDDYLLLLIKKLLPAVKEQEKSSKQPWKKNPQPWEKVPQPWTLFPTASISRGEAEG